MVPYLNDFSVEGDTIYDLLNSDDKESFKLGIDLLTTTNWFVKNKAIVYFLLCKSKYSYYLNNTNIKYIIKKLDTLMNNIKFSDIDLLADAAMTYRDLDCYYCRKALEPMLRDFINDIAPEENAYRTTPKTLEEQNKKNTLSIYFKGLLEIANLKIVFHD